jgi:hypothetical protein
MFLPVLLVRDFGIWGFVVFAVPNVVGAAGMGWVVKSPELSTSIVRRHRPACIAFSLVTMAFQAFFYALLLGSGTFRPAPLWMPVVPVAAAVAGCGRRPATRFLGAVAVLAFSGAVFVVYFLGGDPAVVSSVDARPMEVVWLAPICAFGFGLCPYLDLTFHRARRNLPGAAGARAFGVGFVVFFLPMILFTLAYLTSAVRASWFSRTSLASSFLHSRCTCARVRSRPSKGGTLIVSAIGTGAWLQSLSLLP